jgi:glutaminase
VLSVMNSCGMYDYAGEWAYEVGMPAKSGVSGCIIAVIPRQQRARDSRVPGNLRGVPAAPFNNRTNVRSVIRRDYRADLVRSNRLRTPEERAILAEKWRKVAVRSARCAVLRIDRTNVRAARGMAGSGAELVFASMADDGPLAPLARAFAEPENKDWVRMFRDADAALEWCENELLAVGSPVGGTKFALSEINLFKWLNPAEHRLLEAIVQPLIFEKGEIIIREGADANLFFVLARGTVSVHIRVPGQGERKKRVTSIGPGLSFGEMALLDGGKRSADIITNERVICYGLRVEQLHELAAEHPNIMIAILGNLTREFSERLRHANEEIGVLE